VPHVTRRPCSGATANCSSRKLDLTVTIQEGSHFHPQWHPEWHQHHSACEVLGKDRHLLLQRSPFNPPGPCLATSLKT
jgi:hypothetical protein